MDPTYGTAFCRECIYEEEKNRNAISTASGLPVERKESQEGGADGNEKSAEDAPESEEDKIPELTPEEMEIKLTSQIKNKIVSITNKLKEKIEELKEKQSILPSYENEILSNYNGIFAELTA